MHVEKFMNHETDVNVTDSHGSDFMGSGDIAGTKHPPRDNYKPVNQPARSVGRSVVSELPLGPIPQVIHCNLDQFTTSALKPVSSVEHRANYNRAERHGDEHELCRG